MATEFIMPRVADQPHQLFYSPQYQYEYQFSQTQPYFQPQPQPQSQPQPQPQQPQPYAHYRSQSQSQSPQSVYQQQQISPLSTSDDASSITTSPMSQHNRRQPFYMPAVLRPNLYPSKHSPGKKSEDADRSSLQSNQSSLALNGWALLGRLTRRATADSAKGSADDDDDDDGAVQWNFDLFPKPTAQPTRDHWKADPESTMCDEPSCMRRFSYFTRRHHCRKCGNIFCDWHSAHDVPLDQNANYNPRGTPSRACAHCFLAFKAWRSRNNSQASSDSSSVANGSQTAPTSPVASTPTAVKGAHQHPSEVAMSVPRDWNWSTF